MTSTASGITLACTTRFPLSWRRRCDVAAAFNIPVYNTVYGGWVTVAGTSASAPLIAGIYGLAGNGARTTQKFLYAHAARCSTSPQGTTSGSPTASGAACGFDSLCVAGPGYDAPTGLGTPDGTGAF